jgi:hypothetical protein
LVERLADGRARRAERDGQLPFGRQLIAIGKNAGLDRMSQPRGNGVGAFGRNEAERLGIDRLARLIHQTFLCIM